MLPLKKIMDRKLTITIDALDELSKPASVDERSEFFELLAGKWKLMPPNIRLFVTGRPHDEIISAFNRYQQRPHIIELDSDYNLNDLRLYSEYRMNGLRHRLVVQNDDNVVGELATKVAELANGLFIWIVIVYDEILDNKRKKVGRNIPKEIDKLAAESIASNKLETLYKRIFDEALEELDEAELALVRNVLGAVLYLRRPLSEVAIAEILGIPHVDVRSGCVNALVSAEPSIFDGFETQILLIGFGQNSSASDVLRYAASFWSEHLASTSIVGLEWDSLAVFCSKERFGPGLLLFGVMSGRQDVVRLAFNCGSKKKHDHSSSELAANKSLRQKAEELSILKSPLLYEAAKRKDAALCRTLIECAGSDVDCKTYYTEHDKRPLHIAALQKSEAVINVLLEHSADVTLEDWNEMTPSDYWAQPFERFLVSNNKYQAPERAIFDNNDDLALALADESQLVHKTDPATGKAALAYAIKQGRSRIAIALIERGFASDGDDIMLREAARSGLVEVARLLLDRGADKDACEYKPQPKHLRAHPVQVKEEYYDEQEEEETNRCEEASANDLFVQEQAHKEREDEEEDEWEDEEEDEEDEEDEDNMEAKTLTPLHIATQGGHIEMVRLLLEHGAEKDARTKKQTTPLHWAAQNGHDRVARLLLDRGADLNARTAEQSTPLHFAGEDGHVEVARLLLERGADKDARDEAQLAPLHFAAFLGHVEVVRLLLDHSADRDARDLDQQTPLHLAAQAGHIEVVKLLLERGADRDARAVDQSTPLHAATQKGHIPVVQLLLERGADTKACTADQWMPLHFAAQDGHVEVVRLLLDHNAEGDAREVNQATPLQIAAQNGHVEAVRLLLDHGADKDARNEDQWTPLHYATENGHVEVVRLLLDRGADRDSREEYQRTPLHIAARKGHVEVTRLLLDHSADKDAREAHQSTPLLLAAQAGHVKVVQLLLDRGADREARDLDKETPLHVAVFGGSLEVVRLLLRRGARTDTRNKNQKTPVQIAVQLGHDEVAQLLQN
ncbi:hypothetical protein HK405_014554 [Cladochytrium tenue]|nr:hypothetical protein HK405_014554 [Cladochytrium tenue]